jgi:hypothetical protein
LGPLMLQMRQIEQLLLPFTLSTDAVRSNITAAGLSS